MPYLSTRKKQRSHVRRELGSVLPVLLSSVLLIFAFLALTVDIMKEFLAAQQLNFAARAAALDLLPFACLDSAGQIQNDPVCLANGAFSTTAVNNFSRELSRPNGDNSGQAWNLAISNSDNSNQSWMRPVTFSPDSIGSGAAASPSGDLKDPLLRLTVNRTGADGLQRFFMPVVFGFNNALGIAVPQGAQTAEQIHTVEVAGQPASLVGAAVPVNGSTGKAQSIFEARAASFPLCINYNDFKRLIAGGASAPRTATAHLSSSQQAQYSSSSELRAYFVNLASGTQVNGFYNAAQDASSVNDLIGTLIYFSAAASLPLPESLKLPSAVESGVELDRFTPASIKSNNDLSTAISQLRLNKCYIIPVVRDGLSPASRCQVLGFALLKLLSVTATASGWDFSFYVSESLPVLNSSCSGRKCIPSFDGSGIPPLYDAQNSPFRSRSFDPAANSLSARPLGVVMAPVISPRRLSN